MTNCTFEGNSADSGGGMKNSESISQPTVTNCTFGSNSTVEGGGMHNAYDSSPRVANCIFWGDSPAEIQGSPAAVTYSDIQGSTEATLRPFRTLAGC